MIKAIIHSSIQNRLLVMLMTLLLAGWGAYSARHIPLDALPDLSDVQVIIKTSYPGQAPQVVESQITYPLATALLAVPGAVSVRGYSGFGDSFVYVIFKDGVDLYWARSRVLEYLSQIAPRLPPQVQPTLGPDATGVGWVYEYALVDRSGQHDLAKLRSLQDWFLKYELQSAPGVSEVATVGGMVKQYQVVIDPNRLRAYGLPLSQVRIAIQNANQEVGGSVIEMAEAEYMVRSRGYLQGVEDLRQVPLGVSSTGTPILLGDVAEVRIGPQLRLGAAELDGEGEAVGGIIVMRSGENALTTIEGVKAKLEQLRRGLPEGVEIVEAYDRSNLILRAVRNLGEKLVEEFVVVVIVCALFLFHLRSSLVILISLPVGILAAFAVMRWQGINANILSLGGIAIAIGAMVDATIVMVENLHKHLEKQTPRDAAERWRIVEQAAGEVGPPLFFSLLIITFSFLPVFSLEAQEGRLFAPLAYTKTYAMAVAAGLSITLAPVLMGWFVRGHILPEHKNPLNRLLIAGYRPFVDAVLRHPWPVVVLAGLLTLTAGWPLARLGVEFMPDLDEGDLLYMPTTFPAIAIGKAVEVMQQTDKLIRAVPEVKRVFGKVGRAETATDPAPLSMIETVIQLKPRSEWRPGLSTADLIAELDRSVKLPGVSNAWVMPIKNRINMLATGIKTPLGIKVAGSNPQVIQQIGEQLEPIIRAIPGAVSVYSERVAGGRYVDIAINRLAAARLGLNISDVQEVINTAVGGMNITETVEGLERYPVNLRYPQEIRDSLDQLRALPIITPTGASVPLSQVAAVEIVDGSAMLQSENARLIGITYVDIQGRDIGSFVAEAQKAVAEQVALPAGYSLRWSGQYEYLTRALAKLQVVAPVTLAVIFLLLYLSFGRLGEAILIMATLPFALLGGVWLLYGLGYNLSVAVGVGFIALAGVAAETGVVMLVYLDQALAQRKAAAQIENRSVTLTELREAVIEGALLRVRPKMMTVVTIIAGLLPIMYGTGAGSEVMRRIAAPMVGGMISATLLTLVVIPAVFLLWQGALIKRENRRRVHVSAAVES
ncbi:efflux RND transporter permease subunit [Candidatus Contendibacter odensensis]|uniref:Copper/silver efflux system, membrane component n=1 Tax=Candidatus Contendobacter odensis Run_B_J11 TaxID=1400861 RepID=A0A7U7GC28_9GAMM|nr:CusA/CzcA family heavy metal efflux RND transporter [Candidatus Contendobacter odensis]CDH45512.1 copper/silver efflux system, membrane component [Candidatus Contendobacter odensis Run_B_J11]